MISFKHLMPALFVAGVTITGLTATAEAAPYCHGRMEGRATGQGLFGLGTENAKAAAIADWQYRVSDRWGQRYAYFSNARGVRWDCKKGAILQAKCVVTALPCR